MSKLVHKLVAKTAKEIAAEVWEVCSSNDAFHKQYPYVRPFVAGWWSSFIGDARKALSQMLVPIPGTEKDPDGPKYRYVQHIRDEVFEALLIEGVQKSAPTKTLAQIRAEQGIRAPDYARGHRRLDA